MAGLIKRKNKWVAVYKDASGKEVRKTTKIDIVPTTIPQGTSKKAAMAKNEARARIVAEELETAAKSGRLDAARLEAVVGVKIAAELTSGATSTRAYLSRYLAKYATSERRRHREGRGIASFVDFLGPQRQDTPLSAITPETVREWIFKEVERVSASTVKRYATSLSAAFNTALDQGLIPKNPFRGYRKLIGSTMEPSQERDAFTPDEINYMIANFPSEWPDMIRTCLYTGGQRLGDIATLTWAQVNTEGGIISMTTQKTKRRMNKPLIAPLRDLLNRRYSTRINQYVFPLAAMRFAQAGNTSSKLSLEFHSLLLSHALIQPQTVQTKGDRRILSNKSFHSLRASAVTMLRLAGVPADICRIIVGHDSEEIERVYFRPLEADITRAMSAITNQIN